MVKIPDKLPAGERYEIHKNNYRQIKTRLKTLQTNMQELQDKLATNNAQQNANALFQNMALMGLVLNDLRQALRMLYGVHRDDDTDI